MRYTENRNSVKCKTDKIRKMTKVKTTKKTVSFIARPTKNKRLSWSKHFILFFLLTLRIIFFCIYLSQIIFYLFIAYNHICKQISCY